MPSFPELSPETWDEIFKPRGPWGLASGRTLMDFIPGLSQGLTVQDLKQDFTEGNKVGIGSGLFALMAGGPGKVLGKFGNKVADIAEARSKLKTGPLPKLPDEPAAEVFDPNVIKSYRLWKNAQRAKVENELSTKAFHEEFGIKVSRGAEVIDSLVTRFKGFLKPGKLPLGNAAQLREAVTRFEKSLDNGSFKMGDLEEVDAIVGALDDAGSLTTTDQIIEILNSLDSRKIPL